VFANIENLTGGAGEDLFRFLNGGSISGTIDGAGGINTLDYSPQVAGVAVDLQTGSATGVSNFTGINKVKGGSGADTLRGLDASNVWTVSGLDTGSVGGTEFSDIENLEGGSVDDTFVIESDGSLTGVLAGGLGLDELIGADQLNTWTVDAGDSGTLNSLSFEQIESLVGGSDEDEFLFALGGFVSGHFTGGPGLDRVRGADQRNIWRIKNSNDGKLNDSDFSAIENIEGGSGEDDLLGPAADTTWNVTGANSGDVAGVAFSGIENLIGAADNEDTFIFGAGASLTGLVEGGDGGFDTMIVDDGVFGTVTYTASNPDSGTVDLDGNTINYSGLEPITIGGTATDVVLDLSQLDGLLGLFPSDDNATLAAGPVGQLTFSSNDAGFEFVTFSNPSSSLTVLMGGGDDDLHIETLDAGFAATLNVLGNSGSDRVFINENLSTAGNDLFIDAETIELGLETGNQTSSAPWAIDTTHLAVEASGTSGLGTGMKVDITVDALGAPTVTLVDAGSGYAEGDTVTFTDPGGVETLTVTVLREAAIVSTIGATQSGDITFQGETISVGPGAQLLADGPTPGNILFSVEMFAGTDFVDALIPFVNFDNSTVGITLDGATVKGGVVEFSANADHSRLVEDALIIGNQISDGAWTAGATHLAVESFTTNGTGTGMKVDIRVDALGVATATLVDAGSGYAQGDTVTFNDPDLGGGTLTVTVVEESPSLIEQAFDKLGGALEAISIIGGVASSTTDARILVGEGSSIVADSFSAIAEATSNAQSAPKAFGAAIAIAIANTTAEVIFEGDLVTTGNAFIRSGADNTVSAVADNSKAVKGAAASVAVSVLNSTATAHVTDTAKLIVGGDLVVRADTVDRNLTKADSSADDDGFLGVAVAVSDEESATNAFLDGEVDAVGNISVTALQKQGSIPEEKKLLKGLITIPSSISGVSANAGVGDK
ncbi:MAG: hypothetical protein OEM99_17595, partial [Gammaproteobacteria bacterium]|nr:hypothetical protein [Gammaproteobacteria bacterium]